MNSIERGLMEFRSKVISNVKKGIAETAAKQFSEASSRAPVDTSNLKQSINMSFTNSGLTGVVSVSAEYAKYIEFGTGIYAKGPGGSRAKKIPWVYEKNGKFYRTNGQAAQPFWYPALHISRDYFNSYFNRG